MKMFRTALSFQPARSAASPAPHCECVNVDQALVFILHTDTNRSQHCCATGYRSPQRHTVNSRCITSPQTLSFSSLHMSFLFQCPLPLFFHQLCSLVSQLPPSSQSISPSTLFDSRAISHPTLLLRSLCYYQLPNFPSFLPVSCLFFCSFLILWSLLLSLYPLILSCLSLLLYFCSMSSTSPPF